MSGQQPRVRKTLSKDCPAPDPIQARRIVALLNGRTQRDAKPVPAPAAAAAPDAAAS